MMLSLRILNVLLYCLEFLPEKLLPRAIKMMRIVVGNVDDKLVYTIPNSLIDYLGKLSTV